jgi:hypothetical protein
MICSNAIGGERQMAAGNGDPNQYGWPPDRSQAILTIA